MQDFNDVLKNTTDRQVFSTREISAPVARVYEAFNKPEQLAVWWGPNGFTNTFHIFDHQPDGRWSYTMHGPDGVGNYPNEATFLEIIPQKRIVWDRQSQPFFYTFIELEDLGDKTRINWIMAFEDERVHNSMIKFVPEKNEENLDRLEAFLKKH